MNDLDVELKKLFRRVEPPRGFADRVLARVRAESEPAPSRWRTFWRMPAPRLIAAGALVCVLALAPLEYRRYQGERAKQRLLVAVEITGDKLKRIQKRVQDVSQRRFHE